MRPRKAAVNSVVRVHAVRHGVVVAYRDDVKTERYLVIETDALGRSPRGAAVWYDSSELTPIGRNARPPGRVYRMNQRIGSPEMRGCACQCCPHVAGVEPDPE